VFSTRVLIFNAELNNLAIWFKANKLSLKIKKTNYMIFSNRKKVANEIQNIEIDKSVVTRVKECKFLGVIIDEHLSWTYHINLISSKIDEGIGILCKMSHFTKQTTMETLY